MFNHDCECQFIFAYINALKIGNFEIFISDVDLTVL